MNLKYFIQKIFNKNQIILNIRFLLGIITEQKFLKQSILLKVKKSQKKALKTINNKKYFSDLKITFPLFEGPINETQNYCGVDICSLCKKKNQHCFNIKKINDIKICYSCLRKGKETIPKNTEYGLINSENMQKNLLTNIKIPIETIHELLRTPNYNSEQGEKWLFCCKNAMTYIGKWENEDFSKHAPNGNGENYFYKVINDQYVKDHNFWNKKNYCGLLNIYVFHCKKCGKHRAHWDFD